MGQQKSSHWRIVWSYTFDWILYLGGTALVSSLRLLPEQRTEFSLHSSKINFTYHPNQIIPVWLAILLSPIVPSIFMLITCGLALSKTPNTKTWKGRAKDFHQVFLGIAYAILSAYAISAGLEKSTGQPRPDLIDRCQVDPAAYLDVDIMVHRGGMVDSSVCMQTDHGILAEGFASFPSGHCAVSFAGLTYFAYFLALRLSVLKPHPTPVFSSTRASIPLFRILIAILPLVLATAISVTRILDNRHHPFDVLFGNLTGILCAWVAYRAVLLPHSRAGSVEELGHVSHTREVSQDLESYPLARVTVV